MRLPSKSESGECENETVVRGLASEIQSGRSENVIGCDSGDRDRL